jgi:hypothetical protein
MSLSKPIELRQLNRLLLPVCRQGKRVSQSQNQAASRPALLLNCKAQTSSLAYSNKMIKEDHLLACTTRMFENIHLVRLRCTPTLPNRTSSRRSDYSLVKEQLLQTSMATFVTIVGMPPPGGVVRQWGRQIVSSVPVLSIACREN